MDTFCCLLQVIKCPPQHDLWPKQQPVSPRFTIGHAHAAGIHDPHSIDDAVKLHVRVPTDNNVLLDASQYFAQACQWRGTCDNLFIALWGTVAEQHVRESVNVDDYLLRQSREKVTVAALYLLCDPDRHLLDLFRQVWIERQAVESCDYFTIGVAPN